MHSGANAPMAADQVPCNRHRLDNQMHISFITVFRILALCISSASVIEAQRPAALAAEQNARSMRSPTAASERPFVLGDRPFSPASSWNTPIPASARYSHVRWPSGSRFGVAWNSYSPAIYVSSSSDSPVSVAYPEAWGYRGGALHVRMPLPAEGARGTDGELLIIDGGVVHNFWQFRRIDKTTATASSYAAADVVSGTGWGRVSPFRGAGIVAAGSSQLAGLLIQAETDRGEIAHALQLCINMSLAKPGPVGDAISSDGKNPGGIAQLGEHLAIPPNVPMPVGLSALGQKVFRAYQRYGAFVVDVAGGVTNLRAQANAYDVSTIDALRMDLRRITPLLQRVN
jgi:hypothetical protein